MRPSWLLSSVVAVAVSLLLSERGSGEKGRGVGEELRGGVARGGRETEGSAGVPSRCGEGLRPAQGPVNMDIGRVFIAIRAIAD